MVSCWGFKVGIRNVQTNRNADRYIDRRRWLCRLWLQKRPSLCTLFKHLYTWAAPLWSLCLRCNGIIVLRLREKRGKTAAKSHAQATNATTNARTRRTGRFNRRKLPFGEVHHVDGSEWCSPLDLQVSTTGVACSNSHNRPHLRY